MKTVVISGCSGGMGLETVKKFTSNGYFVYGLDIKEPNEQIENFKYLPTNLRELKSVQDSCSFIKEEAKEIDAIINTAGIYDLNSLIEMSEEEFIRIFDINVFAVYRLNKELVPILKKNGKVIIVSSELAPLDPLPFTGIYAITKSTLEKYAYSLRMELQLLDYQVSIIRPGAVDTKLINDSNDKIEKFNKNTKYYSYNAKRFKKITDSVENRKIPPIKIANLAYKIVNKKKAKYVYKINRNPLLLILNAMPQRFQNWVIKKVLISK